MTVRGAGEGPGAGADISKLPKAVHTFEGGNQTAFVVSAPGKLNSPLEDQLTPAFGVKPLFLLRFWRRGARFLQKTVFHCLFNGF